MITLQQALSSNQNVLGAGFENLGRKGHIYLSFDQTSGWSVKSYNGCLGIFQRFLRWLGLYSDTHLKNIVRQIGKEANVPAPLLAKINDCWRRLPMVNEAKVRVVPNAAQVNQLGAFIGDTYISIEAGDIRQPGTTAIVNAANEECLGGGGVDGLIHKAFPGLKAECEKLPVIRGNVRCETGTAVITKSGRDKGVLRVIHAVGPQYDNEKAAASEALLRSAYTSSLAAAQRNGIRSVAFPAISTGIFGYPFADATRIAIQAVKGYVAANPDHFNAIKLIFMEDVFEKARPVWNAEHESLRNVG